MSTVKTTMTRSGSDWTAHRLWPANAPVRLACTFQSGTGTVHVFDGGPRCVCGSVATPGVYAAAGDGNTVTFVATTPAGVPQQNEAVLRLYHVRAFLAALDARFPEGIPVDYADAIAAELAPLEAAAAATMGRL